MEVPKLDLGDMISPVLMASPALDIDVKAVIMSETLSSRTSSN